MSDVRQESEIRRVRGRIGPLVIDFARLVGTGKEFGIEQLQSYILSQAVAAPASPDRILRDLRQRGLLDYVVVSRRGAVYRFTVVPAPEQLELAV